MRRYLAIVLATAALAVALLVPAAAMAGPPAEVKLPNAACNNMPDVAIEMVNDACEVFIPPN